MAKQPKLKRPYLGARVVRGLVALADQPIYCEDDRLEDLRYALRYIRQLEEWHKWKHGGK